MALLWVSIHFVIVPRIGEFRPLIEHRLSTMLGVSLRIGAISARVNGLMPVFEMRQVRLLDAQGRDALLLKTVTAAVSPQSLMDLGFEQLLIEQPDLAIRRTSDGRITVAGLDVSLQTATAPETSVAADWLFAQSEIVIRSGTLRWTDELRAAPTLALSQADVYLRNEGRKHQLRIDATPPPEWGSRFTIAGDFRGPLLSQRPGDWRSWRGQVHANLPQVDVRQLRQYTNIGVDVDRGHGALRAWVSLNRGLVRDVTIDAALADVSVRLRQDLEPLMMSMLSGRFDLQLDEINLAVKTENLDFALHDGLRWPGGNVQLAIKDRDDGARLRGEFTADRLDLAALAQISDRLPLEREMHAKLKQLNPQGVLPSVSAKWTGPLTQPSQYEVEGSAQSLRFSANANRLTNSSESRPADAPTAWSPGLENAKMSFKFNERGGSAQLRVERGSITLPGIFEEPTVPLDEFAGDIAWQVSGKAFQVDLTNFKFANVDAQGEGKARWQTADPSKSASRSRFPGVLDLQGTLAHADGTKVHRYLPLGIALSARRYVRDAVREGKATQGRFRVRGDLSEFPFADPNKGEFLITAQVSGATLDYVPLSALRADGLRWPALTQINGTLVFDRQSLAVRGASAQFTGAPSLTLSKVDAFIANLNQAPQVGITADMRGAATDVVRLINSSPLHEVSNKALTRTVINGPSEMKVRLLLPIDDLEKSRVQGTVTLPGNDLQFSPQSPALQLAKGQILFSEKGFSLRDASARAFGGEVRLDGGTRIAGSGNDVTLAVRAQGTLTAEGLRQAKELGYVSRLAEQASGSTAYTASLSVRRGVPEILVNSNLKGLGLNLPPPMFKAADDSLPLRYENSLLQGPLADGGRLQDQVSLELGSIASINYLRDVSTEKPRVLRGRIGVGLAAGESIAATDDLGVAANINFSQLNLDAWERLLSDAPSSGKKLGGEATALPGLSADLQAYLPSVVSVRSRELTVQGRTLHNVVVGGSRDNLTWRANLDARELNGYVEYRQPSNNNAGRVFARLARLALENAAVSDIEAALDQQPSSIPALDIVVEDFELRGTRLGRVELEALNRESGGVREWRLSRLGVSLPEAQFIASGNWALVGANLSNQHTGRRRTALNFKLDIADTGEFLKRFGQDKVIAKGSGNLQGQIAWIGAPWALDYPSMTGGFGINIENGQFLKADPGLAKLLGVLSLQSLPRRLALDFRDVFTEGFAFDFVRGDVKIDQGIAFTNNLQMKGVNAAVLMEGTANIARETQDIKLVVVPELNAGTASLVAAAINPAIGIGTFLAQLILRRPVIAAATQEFHVTGGWAEPQIVRVKRNSIAPAVQPPSSSATSTEAPPGVVKP